MDILLETWKGDSDKYKVIGYNCISKARKKKKKARRHSGGIIIYFKKMFPLLEKVETSPSSEIKSLS
jgi:hypothetical protein